MRHQLKSSLALVPDTRFGVCEILSLIGSGGTREVYRVRGGRLFRNVVIKVLSSEIVDNLDRLARFEHERQLLASLNDPNIAPIHGAADSGERRSQNASPIISAA